MSDTSSSTEADDGQSPPAGHRGTWSSRRPKPRKVPVQVEEQAPLPVPISLPAEAHALFHKISTEALAKGSAVGSLRYLRRQLLDLGAHIDSLIEKIERGQAPQISQASPDEAAK